MTTEASAGVKHAGVQHASVQHTSGESVGFVLWRAREVLGLTRAEVAARLRLTPETVAAIEEGNWENLPGEASALGFARGCAHVLNVEFAPLAPRVRAEYARATRTESRSTLRTSLGARTAGFAALRARLEGREGARLRALAPESARLRAAPARLHLAVAVLLAAALVLSVQSARGTRDAPGAISVSSAVPNPPAVPLARTPEYSELTTTDLSPSERAQAIQGAAERARGSFSPRFADTPAPAAGELILAARKRVYVRLTDLNGTVVHGSLLPAGSRLRLSQTAALRLESDTPERLAVFLPDGRSFDLPAVRDTVIVLTPETLRRLQE